MSAVRMEAYGETDRGQVRQRNEDAFAVELGLGLVVVSDGMGGQQAGEIASRVVVETLPRQLAAMALQEGCGRPEEAAAHLAEAIVILSELLVEKSRPYAELRGMGATVVAAWQRGDSLVVAHLGDSRAYMVRGGVLERLTEDHTLAELLLEQGMIDRRGYREHPGRYQLRRYVGMAGCPPPDVGVLRLERGDRILLCTDGLTGLVEERRIGQTLLDVSDRRAACGRLIELANRAGGRDNITVVIADVPGEGQEGRARQKVKLRRQVGASLCRVPLFTEKGLEPCQEPP